MQQANASVWLVNTGWTGGPSGIGKRMSLRYTRALITAALTGDLYHVDYEIHEVFGVAMPTTCPNVPTNVLNPRNTWIDQDAYDQKANYLAGAFNSNFEKFAAFASDEILNGAPKVKVDA